MSYPDDGIPVLTDIVDPALLPAEPVTTPEAPTLPLEAPTLSMFPEPADAPAEVQGAALPDSEAGPAPDTAFDWRAPVDDVPPYANAQSVPDAAMSDAAMPVPDAGTSASGFGTPPSFIGDIPMPASADLLATPDPTVLHAGPGFIAAGAPAANDTPPAATAWPTPAAEPESRDALETRIFEALAARMDRMLDERLESIVPGVVEASLAGIKAGLSASVRQALREAVENAIRDEFERRP